MTLTHFFFLLLPSLLLFFFFFFFFFDVTQMWGGKKTDLEMSFFCVCMSVSSKSEGRARESWGD